MKPRLSVGNMARIGILGALAAILFMIPGIPMFSPFYKLDISNVPALLGAFSMGIVPGVLILCIKALLHLLVTDSGGIGELADLLIGLAMVLPASSIYARQRTRKGALTGMIVGTISMVVMGVLANQFILFPLMLGSFPEMEFLLEATAPFNLIKGIVLCVITWFIYKPLSPFLHGKAEK